MRRKKIIFLFVIIFLLCGCVPVQEKSLSDIIDKSTNKSIEVYNRYRKGYKYNLPKGMDVIDSSDYNETIVDKDYTYYLFVDAVSYYNKVIDTYEVSPNTYVSMPISYEDKYGYLEINKLSNNKYFIEIMYNYAKIEVIVKEYDINVAVANAISTLSSIHFNDDVLKNMLDEETLQFKEYEFNIFETTSTTEDSEYLQTLKSEESKGPQDPHDSDLIN